MVESSFDWDIGIPNPMSNGESAYTEMDETDIKHRIDDLKDSFKQKDIENAQSEMVQIAATLSELYGELADRYGSGPLAKQKENKQERWSQVAQLVLDGQDPTEVITSGSREDAESASEEIEEFRVGTPTTTFDDVGGYDDIKAELQKEGITPIKYQDWLQDTLNRSVMNGVVLCGPPGTGKTVMAEAFVRKFHDEIDDSVTLFKVKPNQLKRGIRGESGKLVRALFTAAKQEQPAAIIFEEIDTLIQDRDAGNIQTMQADRDLVGSILDEINEIDEEAVICLGTTNRPDALDDAAIRDKRLDTKTMGVPDKEARAEIFEIHIDTIPDEYIDWDDIDLDTLALTTEGFTGANIESVVDDAILEMGIEYQEDDRSTPQLRQEDLMAKIHAKKDAD